MKQLFKIAGAAITSAVLLAGCSGGDGDGIETIKVRLTGSQEVPPVSTSDRGSATIKLPNDTGATSIQVELRTKGFSATGVHVHSAFAGKNGPVVFALVQNQVDSSRWALDAVLTPAQLAQLRAGGFYLNAHSNNNPGGEVRGQIVPEGISVKHFALEGSQEVPPVTTPHTGFAAATYNYDTTEIIVNATSDVDDDTAAHIHQAATGVNGGVIIGLTADGPNGWTTAPNTTFSAADLTAYEAGELYVNIHSSTVASGELRGQFPAN